MSESLCLSLNVRKNNVFHHHSVLLIHEANQRYVCIQTHICIRMLTNMYAYACIHIYVYAYIYVHELYSNPQLPRKKATDSAHTLCLKSLSLAKCAQNPCFSPSCDILVHKPTQRYAYIHICIYVCTHTCICKRILTNMYETYAYIYMCVYPYIYVLQASLQSATFS